MVGVSCVSYHQTKTYKHLNTLMEYIMSDNLLITATLTRYADNYGTFRYMLDNRRISKFDYYRLERQATNTCCYLTASYRNRRGDICYRHSYVATFNPCLDEFI